MYANLRPPKIWGKINYLKTNLNVKNININIKHLRKPRTNRPLTENLSSRKPRQKNRTLPRHLSLTPNK